MKNSKNAFAALYVFSFQGSLIYEFATKNQNWSKRPKFRVLYAKKYTGSEKSTPLPFVAGVTNMSYESINGFFQFFEFHANPKSSAALVQTGSDWFGLVQTVSEWFGMVWTGSDWLS